MENSGFLIFWDKFSSIFPKLLEQNGELIITKFDNNPEIKSFLLFIKLLIPSNFMSRDMGPITDNIFQLASVSKLSFFFLNMIRDTN